MSEKRIYVSDLSAGMALDQVFAVVQKDLRKTKKGDYYISARLSDRTGHIESRMWQASEAVYNGIPSEGLLHIKGRVEEYRGKLQIIIDACRPVRPDSADIADFVTTTPYDIEEMWAELLEILRSIRDKHLRLLIRKFVEDTRLAQEFKKAPAAVQMHHAYAGGLCEHTLSVARAARLLLPHYPNLNQDFVLASVFLHDIAKIDELHCELGIHYTDRGKLVGHITMACIWIENKAAAVAEELSEAFPRKTLNVLQHIILAHHGEHEFGSPKLPAVPEAFFLHYLDNLDAKMWMASNAIGGDTDADSDWTQFIPALQTRLFKHSGDEPTAEGSLFPDYE